MRPEDEAEQVYQAWQRRVQAVAALRQVFVVGPAESGTTLVRCLLDGHPRMVVRGEGGYGRKLLPALTKVFGLYNRLQARDGLPQTPTAPTDQLFMLRHTVNSRVAACGSESDKEVGRLRVVGDKTPEQSLYIDTLGKMYPRARFIAVLRDPRDGETSGWFHLGQKGRESLKAYVGRDFQGWQRSVLTAREQGAKIAGRYVEVRYEDLHQTEEATIKALLAFLDVDQSPAAAAAYRRSGDFRRLSGRKRGQKKNDDFWRNGLVGDWRNHLPWELAQAGCDTVSETIRSAGNDPDCNPADAGPPLEVADPVASS